MTEAAEWRPVIDCPNYEVSDDGRVRRATPGKGTYIGRELQQRLTTTGYPTVMFGTTGNARPRKVHQLVADAFIHVRVKGDVVNHLDGDKTNNRVGNLEITTREGNLRHAMENGLIRTGIRHGMAKLTDEQVREIRSAFQSGEQGASIALRYGITRNYAYQIKYGVERASA